MLEKRFRPEFYTSRNDYDLSLPVDDQWESKSQRVLLVLETIDGQDLKEKRLLHERSHTVVTNLLTYVQRRARIEFGFDKSQCAFAVVNFNSYKFFDQPKETWSGHRRRMAKRVRQIIEYMEPTHVIVAGDNAMRTLLPTEEYLEKKRGWVFDFTAGEWQCKISGTLDIQPLYSTRSEDQDADEMEEEGDVFGKANLLYYVSRTMCNALAGRLLYDLSHIKPKVTYVDTYEKFERLHAKLLEATVVAVDTETRNGSVNHNAIHTIQFAMSQERSYFLPVDHPESPFSDIERKRIKRRLRDFFYARKGELPLKYLIMQYGTFDLRILRVELGIPIIFHDVWEIQAGEWCFHPDTMVETEYGRITITQLIEQPQIRVWSQNTQTGARELKKLIKTSVRDTDEELIEIAYEGGTLRVTADHKIWSNTRRCYVKAGEIEEGEDLELFED